MNPTLSEEIFYSKKFQDMKPDEQQKMVNDLKNAFEGDVKKVYESDKTRFTITDQAIARDKFYKDIAQKQNETMGTPLPKTPMYHGSMPDKTKTLEQIIQQKKSEDSMKNFELQDPPMQDTSLDFVPMLKGGLVKNLVVNQDAIATAKTAGAIVDENTPQTMKDQHPDYYAAMQLVTQFGAGGLVFNHAIPKKTITQYKQIDDAVKKGDLTLKQANKAVVDVNEATKVDLEALAKQHLEDTKQPKVTDNVAVETQIADAHVEAAKQDVLKKEAVRQLVEKGVTDLEVLKTQLNKNIVPTEADMLITNAINESKPLSNDLAGANILVKLQNTIKTGQRTTEELYTKLIDAGATEELAKVAATSYEQKNPIIFETWYANKIKTSISNDTKKVSNDINLDRINKEQLEVGSPYPTLRPSEKTLPEQGGGAKALSQAIDDIMPKVEDNINLDTKKILKDTKKVSNSNKEEPIIVQSSPTIGTAALGASAGIETDKDGNINYNMAKGVAGALGASVAYKGATKLYDVYKARGLSAVEGVLPPQTKAQIAREVLQDKFTRVAQLQKAKAGTKEIADEFDTYRAEERYSGRSQNRVENFWRDEIDPTLKEMAQKDIKIEDIDSYLHARHAFERNAAMKKLNGIENGSGMSDADAAKILVKFKDNKDIHAIADKIYKINRDRLKLMLDEGLEPAQKIKDIESMYDNYTPLNRDMGERAINQANGKGFSVKGSGLKHAKGSDRTVESPFMHTILNFQDTLAKAEKNKVGQTFLKFIEKYPDEALYNVENLKYMPEYTKEGLVKNVNPRYKEADNVLHVMVEGKQKQIEIKDPALAKALKNLNQEQMNGFMKVAHKSVRVIASLSTSYNPEFIISNMERDLQSALINLPKEAKPSYLKFLKDMPSALRGIYREERGKKLTTTYQAVFQGMKKNGGTTGWLEQYEIPQMKIDLEQKIRKFQGKDLTKNVFSEVLKYIDDINTAVENTPRLLAYKQSIDAGLTPAKSANIAKNLTVNFNKKGTSGTFLNTAYMFYNASVQGSVRTLQALKGTKAKVIVSGITATGYGLHQYNEMINKDAYNKIPQFEKDTNYIFMQEDGTYLKVKLPYGYNIFKVLGDISAEIQNGETTKDEAANRLFTATANAFSPIGASGDVVTTLMPTLAKPAYEIKTNQNFFGGKIKPEGNPFEPDQLAQSHQYFDSVDSTVKDFAQQLNELTGGTKYTRGQIDISPEYIQHVAEFVTSGLGAFVIRSKTSIEKVIKGEKQDTNKIPFYRLFIGKAREKAETHIAYDLYKESATKVLSDFKINKFKTNILEAMKKGDMEPKKGVQLLKKFQQNQARTSWSKDKNIQSSRDTITNLKSAAQHGVSTQGLVNLAKKSLKDINKQKRNANAPLIKF